MLTSREVRNMAKEDLYLIAVVAFAVLWTASFGWGLFG